ncbi:aromatic acid exporter family protein [Streptomyces sp. NPDC015346]|uniref:FUSC family protein n=1 Tax=Streptomyces sp. NPDC015346 TaxID=3364954 RepID=UPI0036FCCFCF
MSRWGKGPERVWAGAAETAAYVRRAVRSSGSERDDLLLTGKTVVAATAAWMLAHHFLPPTVSTFAPFTALVAVQATVYRSFRESVQYLLAMAVGATLAAALAATFGLHAWTLALLTLIALRIGRVRRLGQQGIQVAVVGLFAFSSGEGRIDYIGHLALSVLVGALCGLAAHLVLAPARHTSHRQQDVARLYEGMSRRTDGLADAFEASAPDPDQVRRWRQDWRRLSADCDRVRGSIDAEEENAKLNPRRGFEGDAEALPRAREALTAAQRCLDHLRSLTRTLDFALADEEFDTLPGTFRSGLGSLLRRLAPVMEELGRPAPADDDRLTEMIDAADSALGTLERQELSAPEARPPAPTLQGALLTDAARLLAELRWGRQALTAVSTAHVPGRAQS